MKPMRTVWTAATLGALTGAVLTAQTTIQVLAQGASITIASFKFDPDPVSAAPNAPITWINNDSAPHQIVIASKNLKTAVLSSGQSAQLKIAEVGSYDYVCGIHGSMKGKIVVK
jgi:plastocyanin